MTADIKPIVTSVKQSYVTNSNVYKQSLYSANRVEGVALRRTSSQGGNGGANRIRSAIFADQGSHFAKEQHGVQSGYTKFRPVTSHPTTSLLASLYKQQSFAESRNSQAAAKLPNITNSRQTVFAGKTNRDLKPFTNPSYSTNLPSSHNQLNGRRVFPAGPKPPIRSNDVKILVGASDTWNAVHDSILANGHGIFNESQQKSLPNSSSKTPSSDALKNVQTRPSVTYVPFYEVRGRGDGASVVDIPSIDVEGKKIVSGILETVHLEAKPKSSTFSVKQDNSSSVIQPGLDEANINKKSDDQSSVKVADSNEDAPSTFVSSFHHQNRNEPEKSQTPIKVEKKVRFSGMITTNKISEEPSYTEALISSMHKSFKQHKYLNTVHRTIASNLGATEFKDADLKQGEGFSESFDASSRMTGEDEDQAFVTPVMKVVVTKRETPAGAEHQDSSLISPRDPRDPKQQATPLQVSLAASRIINNQASLPEKGTQSRPETRQLMTAELIRKGTQATQRASTAGYGRRKEAIARMVKLVPKRQTVIMPNFNRQPAWPKLGRNFSNQGRLQKYGNISSNSPAFSASVQGNNFNQQQIKEIKLKQTAQSSRENLKSRLTGTESTVMKRLESSQANSSRQLTEDRKKMMNGELAATPLVALPTTENVSQIGLLSPRLFADFQPIPSMPDHINFCDPRKTELILHWLEDVNKKRNIESRLRRAGLSK